MLSVFKRTTTPIASMSNIPHSHMSRPFAPSDTKSSGSTTEEESVSISSTVDHTPLPLTAKTSASRASPSTQSDVEDEHLSNEHSMFNWDTHISAHDDSPLTDFKFEQPGTLPFLQEQEPVTAHSHEDDLNLNTLLTSVPTVSVTSPMSSTLTIDFTSFLEKLEKTQNGELTTISQQMMVLIARHFHDSIKILKGGEYHLEPNLMKNGSRVVCNFDLNSKEHIIETVKNFLHESQEVLAKRDDLAEALKQLFSSILEKNSSLEMKIKHEVERENFSFDSNDQQSLQFQLNTFRNGFHTINSFHTTPSSFYLQNFSTTQQNAVQNTQQQENTPNSQIFDMSLKFPNLSLGNNNLNNQFHSNTNGLSGFHNVNNNLNNTSSFTYAQNLLNQNTLQTYENANLDSQFYEAGENDNNLEEKIFGLRRKRKIKVNKDVSKFLLEESKKRQFKLPKSFRDSSLLDEDEILSKKKVSKGKQRGRPRKFKTNSVSNSLFSLSGSLTSHNNSAETSPVLATASENNTSAETNSPKEETKPQSVSTDNEPQQAVPNVIKKQISNSNLKSKSNLERTKEENDLITLGLAAVEEKIIVLQQNIRTVKHKHRKGTVCPSCTYEQKLRLCVKAKLRILESTKQAQQ